MRQPKRMGYRQLRSGAPKTNSALTSVTAYGCGIRSGRKQSRRPRNDAIAPAPRKVPKGGCAGEGALGERSEHLLPNQSPPNVKVLDLLLFFETVPRCSLPLP